ncbi:PEX6 [Candida pseudojiufengensis]|uniref:PEX6 n=1 Tax=Candida pseudojiufengensis TaxID=497109 RepID=UPI002224D490|nr:PEX6 [Candida pseudojiufengensis]KAI5964891.1 PEX6 [Candida pseudojiufengensis]
MPSIANGNTINTQTQSTPSSAIANVNIINDPKLNQYDIVEISKDIFSGLFPDINEQDLNYPIHTPENTFILVKLLGAPDFFNKFQILKIDRVLFKQTNSINFINNSNLVKFNSDSLTLNKAIVKPIDSTNIPKLTQVFVSAPNDIYHLLKDKSQQSIKQLFVTQFLTSNGNVVNEGDCIREINGKVKLCEPLAQGLVDFDTNFVLINQNEESVNILDNLETEEIENDPLDLSSYLSSSLQFDKVTIPSPKKFLVKPLPEKMNVNDLPEDLKKEDSELFVYINNSDFIKLGFPIYNGDLVKIKTPLESIIVRIFNFTEPQTSFKNGSVYISPILLVNLNLQKDTQVEFERVEESTTLTSLIPIAESATISRISSQITMDKTYQANFFSSLKTKLSDQLKCVKQGDYFPVVIDTVLSKVMFDNSNDDNQENESTNEHNNEVIPEGNPDAVAWFKITEVKGINEIGTNQFLIDPAKTLLVSSGVESTKLPMNTYTRWYQYLNLPPIFNYSGNIKNFKYAQEFSNILKTCTTSKLNLRTSILLTSMSRGIGKTTLVRSTCIDMGLNLIELDCFDFINPGQELKTIGLLSGKIDKYISNVESNNAFHVIYLKHIENLCPKTDENDQNSSIFTSLSLKIIQLINDYLENYSNLAFVMSCNDYDKLNDNLKSIIKFNIEFTVPTENERLDIFKYLIENEKFKTPSNEWTSYPFVIRKDINYKTLALQSAGLTPRDLISIIKKSKKLAIKRLLKLSKSINISLDNLINIGNGGIITWIPEDFELAINEARNQFSDSIGAPRIPNVKWEDIGGLDLVKDEILDTIDMPLKHPELFNNGLKKRSGILFYGPPGTGKTLLAKAIATNFSLNFFSVKGPELLNMYIGESEANVRRVFQRARDAKPCVIFFDELDSVAPKRGNQGDSGGVMDRIVSQLLAELDGMSSEGGDGVFVVGATNRPDLLDEALLRPGRFDKMLYLGISDTNEKQTKILEALTRKFKLDDNVNLEEIAERCTFTYTGADFYAICSDSMLNAMTRVANEVDEKIKKYNEQMVLEGKQKVNSRWWFDNVATKDDINVLVKMEDFIKAQTQLNPSVSAEELQHYLRVRENFEGGKAQAQEKNKEELNGLVNGNGH